jgi:predicted RNase H-like nuclease
MRAAACDELVRRTDALSGVRPPLDLRSNPVTQSLLEPSPLEDRAYKHREDLIDALLAAWTAALWHDHRLTRCQVLGAGDPLVDEHGARATIIAPARPEQRPAAP